MNSLVGPHQRLPVFLMMGPFQYAFLFDIIENLIKVNLESMVELHVHDRYEYVCKIKCFLYAF